MGLFIMVKELNFANWWMRNLGYASAQSDLAHEHHYSYGRLSPAFVLCEWDDKSYILTTLGVVVFGLKIFNEQYTWLIKKQSSFSRQWNIFICCWNLNKQKLFDSPFLFLITCSINIGFASLNIDSWHLFVNARITPS